MKIFEVYKTYTTPPNLQGHLLMVTKIILAICDSWKGKAIDKDNLVKAALLHDLANIVKFDFINHPEFLGPEVERIQFWIEQQKVIKEKYGTDDHEATKKMLEELGISQEVANIIVSKSFGNSILVSNSSNTEAKILLYADMRVGPFGIVTLRERLKDISTRLEKYKNRPDLPNLIKACENIEKEIQASCTLDLGGLSETNFTHTDTQLLDTEL